MYIVQLFNSKRTVKVIKVMIYGYRLNKKVKYILPRLKWWFGSEI